MWGKRWKIFVTFQPHHDTHKKSTIYEQETKVNRHILKFDFETLTDYKNQLSNVINDKDVYIIISLQLTREKN